MEIKTIKDVEDLIERSLSEKGEEAKNQLYELAEKSPNYLYEAHQYFFDKIGKEQLKIGLIILCMNRALSKFNGVK